MKVITVQPAAYVDNLYEVGDGQLVEGRKLPYPFHVRAEDGHVERQDFWRGDPWRVIGFVNSPESTEITLWWREVAEEPDRAIGKYVVTQNKSRGMATHLTAVDSVTVSQVSSGLSGVKSRRGQVWHARATGDQTRCNRPILAGFSEVPWDEVPYNEKCQTCRTGGWMEGL